MLVARSFEEMTVPDYPTPHPAFKGKDKNGYKFVYCRKPMRVEYDDGKVTNGVFPVVLYQRPHEPEVGLYFVFPKVGESKYVTQRCHDLGDKLYELTDALLGTTVEVKTTGAKVYINPQEGVGDVNEKMVASVAY